MTITYTDEFWRRAAEQFVGQLVRVEWGDSSGFVITRGQLERVSSLAAGASLIISERSDIAGTTGAVIPLSSVKSIEAL